MTTIKDYEEKTVDEVSTCCHHWVIDTPNGPVSRGVCRRCGTMKEFHNSIPGFVGAWARSAAAQPAASQTKANDRSYKPRPDLPEEPDEGATGTDVDDITVAE